ncbi:MAG: NUDIX domain-containing protein [Candidatus Eisenbacteria bacterium]|nr:NUDIX domain-containing protein [Candidatus Eisenbacteria bacterium]
MTPRRCPHCDAPLPAERGPALTVDCIVQDADGALLLIERAYPPPGWALPGGFVETGETVEEAVTREVREETGLRLHALRLFGVYSDPARDPRGHTVSVVFSARTADTPHAGDDAASARFFPPDRLPEELAFDHGGILRDYFSGSPR